jgi:histidine ammonia-lyase
MGSISARKLEQVVVNVRTALAIEILTAAAGLDQRSPLAPSAGVAAAHAAVRALVAPLTEDRPLHGDIRVVADLVATGRLVQAAEAAVGRLA